MGNKVTLYGASGHCKVIMDILDKSNILIDTIVDDDPNNDMDCCITVVSDPVDVLILLLS